MKNLAILLCLALTLSSFGLAYRYSVKARKDQKYLVEERFKRMTAEESLVGAEAKVDSLTAELSRAESKVLAIEKKVQQLESVKVDLQSQIDAARKKLQDLEKTLSAVNYTVTGQP